MIRRRMDRILAQGEGKQLAWLVGIVLVLYGIFCLVGRIWGLDWTDILTLYLDPGNFPIDHQANDFFSLIVTLSGILILSALMISVFSNVFSNCDAIGWFNATSVIEGEGIYHEDIFPNDVHDNPSRKAVSIIGTAFLVGCSRVTYFTTTFSMRTCVPEVRCRK